MAIRLDALMWAIGIGIFVWQFVVPMVVKIPYGLEKAWHSEYMDYAESYVEGVEPGEAAMSQRFKVGISLLAVLITLMLLQLPGINESTVALVFYAQGALLLAAINWRTSLLPDKLVLPLLWAGLLFNASHGNAVDQVYGAALGFAVPWAIYWAFKLGTGKEMMGYGDMKTFAMAGAWLGVAAIPTVFLSFFVCFVLMYWLMKSIEFKWTETFPSGYVPSGIAHLAASVVWIVGLRIV